MLNSCDFFHIGNRSIWPMREVTRRATSEKKVNYHCAYVLMNRRHHDSFGDGNFTGGRTLCCHDKGMESL